MKKLKKIALMLVLMLITNFIPVNAYYYGESKFGIIDVWTNYQDGGDKGIYVLMDDEYSKNVNSIKLYTKIVHRVYDNEKDNYEITTKQGPICTLQSNEDPYVFETTLKEAQITEFASYEVDKIEIILNDGSKRVSYNSQFYTSLSDNDKENGELIQYLELWTEYEPFFVEDFKYEYKVVKLGQAQNFNLTLGSGNTSAEPREVYVTFENKSNGKTQEKIVAAQRVEANKFSGSITLNNSLETGTWTVSKIEIIDNYERSMIYPYYDSFDVVSENTDILAPELKGFEISSNKYDGNNKEGITIDFIIEDDNSGFDYGSISYVNRESGIYTTVSIYEHNIGSYQAEIYNLTKDGTYEVKEISICDKANNYKYYIAEWAEDNYYSNYEVMDFSALTIEAVNCKEDSEDDNYEWLDADIEILDIINDNPQVMNGNEVNYKVKLKSNRIIDDVVISVKGEDYKELYFYSDDNIEVIDSEPDGKIYLVNIAGNLEKYQYIQSGEYYATSINISYYNNEGLYGNIYYYDKRADIWWDDKANFTDLSELDFTCNNKNEDVTAPEIEYISLDKNIIIPGETVEIRIKVKDDKAGFIENNSAISITSSYQIGSTHYTEGSSNFDSETNEYIFYRTIPSYVTTGIYITESIEISDILGNSRLYTWDEDKDILSQATILVKKDLNELLPPEITTNIEQNGQVFKNSFTPIVAVDHGTVEMTLNGKEYNGEEINKIGNYQLYIKATGVDGSISTKKVNFKITGEINNDTKVEEIIDQIISSSDKTVEIQVNNDEMEIDKSIFEAIKGTDKEVSFTQEDGTVWTFAGKDITDKNIEEAGNLKITVSNVAEEKNKDDIEAIDSNAAVIHFDYHGVLPGKATVKIKVDNAEHLKGKDLTFYYYNPETKQAEKVQGPLSIDKDGYVTVEIEHCSDYFLSESDNLDIPSTIAVTEIKLDKTEAQIEKGSSLKLTATVLPENATDKSIIWESSNTNIATVDAEGKVVTLGAGEVSITAKTKDGLIKAICKITVVDNFKVFTVKNINVNSTEIIGTGESGATVKAYVNDKEIGKATVAKDGSYNIKISKQKSGTKVVVKISKSGYSTASKTLTVSNVFSTFTANSINKNSTKITGKGLSGATVKAYVNDKEIGKATVAKDGSYSIKISKQKSGAKVVVKMSKSGYSTTSKTLTVNNVFSKSTVNSVNKNSTKITGTGTSGATVKAYVNNKEIGKATVGKDGKYSIKISKQKKGTKITVKMSKSGYSTVSKTITVK